MSDTTNTTEDQRTDAERENESYREPMRRDHFPIEKGDNQQDDDYMANAGNPSGIAEDNVKWPEVDSEEALDAKIDEADTDKADRIRDAAQAADEEANDTSYNG